MDNRITKAKTYLLLDTTYSHPNIEDPIDDTFEKEAIDLVNKFVVEK